MAKTKEQQSAATRYFKEVRAEMSKVVWPSREQATNLTLTVLAVMLAMGVFLGLLDFIFGEMVQLLLTAIR
ncbi:MAG: preprotein translocase subunit SecE [Chloroflexota bacterium]|nr:preprotein translocase subunit SecE [Chloroflexota bacterium]